MRQTLTIAGKKYLFESDYWDNVYWEISAEKDVLSLMLSRDTGDRSWVRYYVNGLDQVLGKDYIFTLRPIAQWTPEQVFAHRHCEFSLRGQGTIQRVESVGVDGSVEFRNAVGLYTPLMLSESWLWRTADGEEWQPCNV